MSDYQCQICTGTRGWHTSGCRQVSQELAALRQRVAELEQDKSELLQRVHTVDGLYLPHTAPLTTNDTIKHLQGEIEHLHRQWDEKHRHLTAANERIAELEAQLSRLDDSHKRTLTNLLDCDEARIGQIAQLKAQRELITSLTNENEQIDALYGEACEERDAAVDSKNFYASQVAELEAAPYGNRTCPCYYTTPCRAQCSCASSVQSGPCDRCCSWGSDEQRKAKAERIAATPTLELVGGEWGISQNGKVTVRDVGEWTIWVRHRNNIFAWNVEKGCETCDTWIANGTAPTREAAIEAAEQALLEEVGKFVRVKI